MVAAAVFFFNFHLGLNFTKKIEKSAHWTNLQALRFLSSFPRVCEGGGSLPSPVARWGWLWGGWGRWGWGLRVGWGWGGRSWWKPGPFFLRPSLASSVSPFPSSDLGSSLFFFILSWLLFFFLLRFEFLPFSFFSLLFFFTGWIPVFVNTTTFRYSFLSFFSFSSIYWCSLFSLSISSVIRHFLSSPFPTFAVLDVGFEWFCGLRGGGVGFRFLCFISFFRFSLSLSCCYSWFRFVFFFLLFLLFRVLSVGNILLLVVVFFVLLLSLFSLHSPSALLSPLSSLLFSFLCCCFLSFFGQFYKMELTANYFFPKRLNFLFPFSVPLLFLSSLSSYLPPRPISSPRPPLPLLPDISSTSSLHHLLVHALASSPRPPLPPFVAVNTYSFDISSFILHRLFNSPPFSFSIFSHPHCHRHCCWNHLPNHVCLFYLFFSFHVANFIKRGCKFISFVCLFVSGAISARIFYGLSLRWNIKIGLME